MSEALVWTILSKSNGKSMRRTHPISKMTAEKGSLTSRRKKVDSGFCRTKAVDITSNDDGIPVISLKNATPEESRNPDKMWKTVTLSGGVRKALAKTESLLEGYSPSAKKPAMRKVSAIYKAYARKEAGVDHSRLIATK